VSGSYEDEAEIRADEQAQEQEALWDRVDAQVDPDQGDGP